MIRMLFALSFALCTIPLGPVAAQFGSDLGVQHNIKALDQNPHETQESLIWTGFYNGLVDGRIGRRTKKAIENFQIFWDFAIDFTTLSVFIVNIDFVSLIILPFNPTIWGFVD